MSTLRLEPARVGTLAARDGQGRWYGFDLQLAIYALSLIVIGLLMAFTNSGDGPAAARLDLHARSHVAGPRGRGLRASRRLPTTTGCAPSRGPSTASTSLLLLVTLAIGVGHRRRVALGLHLRPAVPVLRGGQDPAGRRAGALPGHAGSRHRSTTHDRRRRPHRRCPCSASCSSSRTSGRRWSSAPSSSGRSSWPAPACAGWPFRCIGVVAMVPVVWAYLLKDYQKQRLVSFLDPTADPLGSGYQLQQSQITVSSGGLLGRGLTNGMAGREPARGSHRLRVRPRRRGAGLPGRHGRAGRCSRC